MLRSLPLLPFERHFKNFKIRYQASPSEQEALPGSQLLPSWGLLVWPGKNSPQAGLVWNWWFLELGPPAPWCFKTPWRLILDSYIKSYNFKLLLPRVLLLRADLCLWTEVQNPNHTCEVAGKKKAIHGSHCKGRGTLTHCWWDCRPMQVPQKINRKSVLQWVHFW